MKRVILNVLAGAIVAAAFIACGGGSGSSGGGKSGKIKMTTEADGDVSFSLSGSGVATVDWGDGSEKVTLTLNEKSVEFKHTYPSATIRTITINGDNITKLSCGRFKLTSLDVSKNRELTSLWVYESPLTSLGVSKNTALTSLQVSKTPLTSLDVSKNTALTSLSVYQCPLTNLDVSKNTALTSLMVEYSPITDLDVSKNTALTRLVVKCPLTSLDVSKNTVLSSLEVSGKFTSLDVSKNTALAYLNLCNSQFTAAELNALFGILHSNSIVDEWNRAKSIDIRNNPGERSCDRSIAKSKGWIVY